MNPQVGAFGYLLRLQGVGGSLHLFFFYVTTLGPIHEIWVDQCQWGYPFYWCGFFKLYDDIQRYEVLCWAN